MLDFSFKIDDDFDDYGSDISLYEESDEESDGENYQDLNPTYLWRVQNSDRFEFPHDIEPFEESSGPVNPPVRTSEPLEYFQWLSSDDNIFLLKKRIGMHIKFETVTT